jgi:hypothetical protein
MLAGNYSQQENLFRLQTGEKTQSIAGSGEEVKDQITGVAA